MTKRILFGLKARSRILAGIEAVEKVVGCTYGPGGRNVILDRAVGLLATKDGYTVSSEVELGQTPESLGCEMLKAACLTVNDQVGDGTTTTAILTAAIIREAHKLAAVGGTDITQLCKDLKTVGEKVVAYLEGQAVPSDHPETIERVAAIAANEDPEIAAPLAEACLAAGDGGLVRVEDGHSTGIEVIYKDGMEIDHGYEGEMSWSPENESFELDGPIVAVVAKVLQTAEDVRYILEEASQFRPRPILVIAYQIEGQARATLFLNREHLQGWGVRCPGTKIQQYEILKDLAAMAGAHLVDPSMGEDPKKFRMEWLGSFRKATLFPKKTILEAYEDKSELIEQRVAQLQLEAARTDFEFDRDHLQERIAKLVGGLVLIRVGAFTEYEAKERRGRVEDALNAIRCALETGLLPGGAKAYFSASKILGTENVAERILKEALREPLRKLIANTGEEPALIMELLEDAPLWLGYDPHTQELRDFSQGEQVPDPFGVIQAVIRASVSVSSTLLMAECAVYQTHRSGTDG
jgi:chaperonin GroEL